MNYRNIRKVLFAILFLLCMCTSINAEAKEKTKTIGNFEYTYKDYKSSSVWITEIIPLSNKGIKTLTIPSYLDGKKVVKIGHKKDNDASYSTDNIFGMRRAEEDWALVPKKIKKRVKKIKKIILPETVKKITPHAFSELQKGKTINIPSGVTKNVQELCDTEWKKMTVSSRNKKYKTKNGVLMSKNGKVVYGKAASIKEIMIPDGAEKIEKAGYLFSAISYIYIPESVKKIDFSFTSRITNIVKIHVSEKSEYYAVADECLYNKKTGNLVVATARTSVLDVPTVITCMEHTFFAGEEVKRIVIPASVKKVGYCWGVNRETLTLVFKAKTPPEVNASYVSGVTIYVPKGCAQAYKNAISQELVYGNPRILEK